MSAAPHHGRRRATTTKSGPTLRLRRGTLISQPAFKRSNSGKQLGIVAVAGVIALSALPVAHAESHRLSSAVTATVQSAAPAASSQQSVTADKDVEVTFAKPEVSSKPAPPAPNAGGTPAAALVPAAALASPVPAAEPVPAAVEQAPAAQPSSGLLPPLAQLNVTSPFGYRSNPLTGSAGELHTGTDFSGACGTAVFAAGAGTVTEAGWSQYGGGNRIVVDHGGGIKTTYNHLESIAVSVGQQVSAGAQIAAVGTTGNSTGCHLHFEVMENDQTVNPAPFL
ncbi:M23 family metallopeptidase [Arthrobacter sp. H35-D1]|uniref:M23 family metallopeptidase n=1 Tax=Arthrobacter sp. H35-D1 TaxID=3046202 RepID=UPI0024BA4A7C|nr:M23 family metallopeptidase [Arthrobacter sp. H35-D1]MDJ0313518.1 M23 family metallopeptidase [Arthrobacter sp. H35-D1]